MRNKMKLLTRKEIIDIWFEQDIKFLKSYCCPSCRDILYEEGEYYYCNNDMCREDVFYKGNIE